MLPEKDPRQHGTFLTVAYTLYFQFSFGSEEKLKILIKYCFAQVPRAVQTEVHSQY
jgi:hypothetical protein